MRSETGQGARPGTFTRHPWLHLLWTMPVAIAGAAYFLFAAAVEQCGFDGCGDANDDYAMSVVLLLASAFCLVSPVLFVPWAKSWRVRAVAAAVMLAIVGFGVVALLSGLGD